jgi:hypothetical protein
MKSNEIARLLPGIFQQTGKPGNPLSALLDVMEHLSAIPDQTLEHVEAYFNPYRTEACFVPFLARWVDLEWLLVQSSGERLQTDPAERLKTEAATFPSGLGRLRELVAASACLAQKSGTKEGMEKFLETATGVPGFHILENVSCEDGKARPFHLCVRAPRASLPYEAMIKRIVEFEKPVYMTFEIVFES